MAVMDGRTWLEHLGTEECWRLLRETPVGRIGVLVDSAPEIYPVNHLVDGGTIVFRTAEGTKLRGVDRSPSVCYQIDGIDADAHTGWSVLVKGRASPLRNAEEVERVSDLALDHWSVGTKSQWVRIVAHQVTGRRIWHGPGTPSPTEPAAPAGPAGPAGPPQAGR